MTKITHQDLGTFPAVLLFGSLALSFDTAAFHQLRKTLVGTNSLTWLADALSTLVDECEFIFAELPIDTGTLNLLRRVGFRSRPLRWVVLLFLVHFKLLFLEGDIVKHSKGKVLHADRAVVMCPEPHHHTVLTKLMTADG